MFKDQDCTISVGEEWAAVESETLRVLTRIPAMTASMSKGRFPTSLVRNIPLMWISFWMKSGISTALSPQKPESRSGFDGGTSLETPGGTYLSVGLPPVEARGLNPKYLLRGWSSSRQKESAYGHHENGHLHFP